MQRYRLKRTGFAFAFYSLCGAIIGVAVWQGLYPLDPFLRFCALFAAATAVFVVAIGSGWSLRFRDPAMTQAQIGCSAVVCSYVMLYAGQLRGGFMLAYAIGLMFGGTQLTMRQLAGLSVVPLALFPLTAFVAAHYNLCTIDWRVESVNWFSLCTILAFTSMLVGHLSRLRARLRAANAGLEAALERLTDAAVHDELTGLFNRRYLIETLQREKARADRNEGAFCVCILDIDHFKRVNDTYGHSAGDQVLRSFARVAQSFTRTADLLGRWGGEEFLLLLPNAAMSEAESCLMRIRAELERTAFEGLNADLRITFSAGVAAYQSGKTIDELVERADHALYAAKNGGRNRIVRDASCAPAGLK